MHLIKNINSTLFFFLELGMFIALAYVGYSFGKSTVTKWLLGIILPLTAILLWGYFAAQNPNTDSN